MNRTKQLVICIVIILVFMFFRYYVGGLYFSEELCEIDMLKSVYAIDAIEIKEFSNENDTYKIFLNAEENTILFVGREKDGLFHKGTGVLEHDLQADEIVDIANFNVYELGGTISMIYRNNPNVSKIEVCYHNGTIVELDNWKSNVVGTIVERNGGHKYIYKAYDSQGNLLIELEI